MKRYTPISIDAAVETTALDAGDVVNNAILNFPLTADPEFGNSGKIVSLLIVDPDHNTAANLAGRLFLFSSTVTQAAADAANAFSDADMLKAIGHITIAAADVELNANNSLVSVRLSAPIPFNLGSGTSIFGTYAVTATPTFAGGTLRFVLGVERER